MWDSAQDFMRTFVPQRTEPAEYLQAALEAGFGGARGALRRMPMRQMLPMHPIAKRLPMMPLYTGQPQMMGGRQLQPTGPVMDIADEGGAWSPQIQQRSATQPIQGGSFNHQGIQPPIQRTADPMRISQPRLYGIPLQ